MRIRSFAMFGVAAALAVACGGAGSGSVGSFAGTGTPGSGTQPPNSSGSPTSSTDVPTNPNQPSNTSSTPGGSLCEKACPVLSKYPCFATSTCASTGAGGAGPGGGSTNCTTTPITADNCLSQCEAGLANLSASELECAKVSITLYECADALGAISCPADGGDAKIADSAAQACSTQLAAVQQYCNDNTVGNGGTCTMNGDQCAGCTDQCSACTCVNNGDSANCPSCAG